MDVRRVGKRLVIAGYVYKKSSQDLSKGKFSWECVRYRDPYLNCTARAITYVSSSGEKIRVHQGPAESPHDHQPSDKELRRAEKIARHDSKKQSAHKASPSASESKTNKSAGTEEKSKTHKESINEPRSKLLSNSQVKKQEQIIEKKRQKTDVKGDNHQMSHTSISQKDVNENEKVKEHKSEAKPTHNPNTHGETKIEIKKSEEMYKLELKTEYIHKSDHDSSRGRPYLIRDPKYYRRFLIKFLESLVFTRKNLMEVLKVVYKSRHSRTVACSIIFENQERVVEDLINLLNDPKATIKGLDDDSGSNTQNLRNNSSDAGKLKLLKSCSEKIAKLENRKLQLQNKCCSIGGTKNVNITKTNKELHSSTSDNKITTLEPSILCVDLTDEFENDVKVKKEVFLINLADANEEKKEKVDCNAKGALEATAGEEMDNHNNITLDAQSANANNELSATNNSSLSDLLKTAYESNTQQQYPNMHYATLSPHMAGTMPWMPLNTIQPFCYADPNLMMNFPTMMGNGQLSMQTFGPFNTTPVMDPMGQMYQPMGFMYPANPESFR